MSDSPELRRLKVPSREELLASYAKVERDSLLLLAGECLAAAVALYVWWQSSQVGWHYGVGVAGIAFCGTFYPFFFTLTAKKKPLHAVREDARFGQHTRDSIQQQVRSVCEKLDMPSHATRVYLTGDKEINAYALRAEFLPGLRLFNSVMLNRGILHLLDPAELESVIAHELGHVWLYAPLLTRCYLIHALAAMALSLGGLALLPASSADYAFFLPLGVLWCMDWLIGYPFLRLRRGIEFLCDDAGMRSAGVVPAVTAELKLALESETRQALFTRLAELAQRGDSLGLTELTALYQEALPFGQSEGAAVESELRQLIDKARKLSAKGPSWGGFAQQIWENRDEEAEREAAAEWVKLHEVEETLPLILWDRASLRESQKWTEANVAALVDDIAQHPDSVIVRVMEELQDQGLTHPNHTRRILCMWKNRNLG